MTQTERLTDEHLDHLHDCRETDACMCWRCCMVDPADVYCPLCLAEMEAEKDG